MRRLGPLLRPSRRPHLCRQPDRGPKCGWPTGRCGKTWHAGEDEAGGDARRFPRQLRVQPARRARPPVQRRSADDRRSGTITRDEQLVPARVLGTRDSGRAVPALGRPARQAFFEYNAHSPRRATERIYDRSATGRSLELFVLDQRSYRGPNSANRQETLADGRRFSAAAASVAQGGLQATGRLEGDRQRYADRLGRARGDRDGKRIRGLGERGRGEAPGRELELASLLSISSPTG